MDQQAEFMTPIASHARPREGLKAAQAEVRRTAAAAEAAAQVARRAGSAADRQHQAVEQHAGLTGRILRWGADQVRRGGSAISPLPQDLAAGREALRLANEREADARGVHNLLAAEAAAAAEEAAAARAVLSDAVEAVLEADALALVERAAVALQEAARLHALIAALSVGRASGAAPLSWALQEVSHRPVSPFLLDLGAKSLPAAGAAWVAHRAALATDPNASAPV